MMLAAGATCTAVNYTLSRLNSMLSHHGDKTLLTPLTFSQCVITEYKSLLNIFWLILLLRNRKKHHKIRQLMHWAQKET